MHNYHSRLFDDLAELKALATTHIGYQWEGYYWHSHDHIPKRSLLIDNLSEVIALQFGEMPFVVEAHFYNTRHDVSLSIKNIDGAYKAVYYNLADARNDANLAIKEAQYIGRYMGAERLVMLEAWAAKVDDLLDGAQVYRPIWTAFAGFSKPDKIN